MRARFPAPWLPLALAVAAGACHKATPPAGAGGNAAGAGGSAAPPAAAAPAAPAAAPAGSMAAATLAAWAGAGLRPDGFGPVDAAAWRAASCTEGMVAGLAVRLCEYADDAAVAEGKRLFDAHLARAGTLSTGVVAENGRALLAVSDHSQADPTSRTANRLVKLFRGQK